MDINDLKYFEVQIERFVELVNKTLDEEKCQNFVELLSNPYKIRSHVILSTARMVSKLEFDGVVKRLKQNCQFDNNLEVLIDTMQEIRKINEKYEESNLVTLSAANASFAEFA